MPARLLPQGRMARWTLVIFAVVVAVPTLFAAIFVLGHAFQGEDPQFESLSENPDPSLHGTVAYFADGTQCVRIRAAAGRPYKDVLCPESEPVSKAEKEGKLVGPQLAWRPDGRLEVTMFRMVGPPEPIYAAGWQKLVDVRSGGVEDVPASDVPAEPDAVPGPAVSPAGERVDWSSGDGRVEVTLTDDSGTRTLLSAKGPSETYGLDTAFWAPDFEWVAAFDGRILVITTEDPAVTRILADESGMGSSFNFAVTDADLLPPAR